jgi:Clathrin adaptor complex small chain
MSLVRQISGVAVTDADGGNLATKYFHPKLEKGKRAKFDSELKQKLAKIREGDGSSSRDVSIVVVDDFIIQVKQSSDVLLCVIFESSENDLLILGYTESLWRCMSLITSNSITKRKVLDKLDNVFLMIDESCERGIILDDDSDSIMSKIEMKVVTPDGTPQQAVASSMDSFRSALAQAKGQLGSFLGR